MLQPHGCPVRTRRSAAPRPRVVISTSAMARSAVASVSTPGVFVTTTPRSRHAATSTLSWPTTTFGDDPQPRAGGVEQLGVDPVDEHRDEGVDAGHRGEQLVARHRASRRRA